MTTHEVRDEARDEARDTARDTTRGTARDTAIRDGTMTREQAFARFQETKRFATRGGRIVVRDAQLAAALHEIRAERYRGRPYPARSGEALPAA